MGKYEEESDKKAQMVSDKTSLDLRTSFSSQSSSKLHQWNDSRHLLDAAPPNYSLHPLDRPRVECDPVLGADPHHLF
jgi:hypothetical protein